MATLPFYLEQFTYQDGVTPLAGGTLNFYTAGTVNASPVYTDHLYTIPVNPVTLNAGGRAPQFFAPSGTLYKVVIKAADGSLIDTRDWVGVSGADGGTVSSVTVQLDAGLSTAMAITSPPVTSFGAIDIEGVTASPNLALMTPVSGNGKPSMRQIQQADVQGLEAALGEFLPLAGGQMDPDAVVYFRGSDPDNYTGVTPYNVAIGSNASGAAHTDLRKGALQLSENGTEAEINAFSNNPQVYLKKIGGAQRAKLSAIELYMVNGTAEGTLTADRISKLTTATPVAGSNGGNPALINLLSTLSAKGLIQDLTTSVLVILNALKLYINDIERISQAGAAFLTNATISSLTPGKLPKAGTAGLLGDSAISEDATTLTATKTFSGTTATFAGAVSASALSKLGLTTFYGNLDSYVVNNDLENALGLNRLAGNAEFDFINNVGNNTNAGGFTWYQVRNLVWSQLMNLNRDGVLSVPSISISTPVTREAIIQPLPITNSAPGTVTVGPSGGVKSFGFDGGASTEELFYHLDVQHDYVAGTNVIFHVHWTPATATGGDVKWQLEYQWVDGGTTWPAPTLASVVTAAGTVAWADKRSDITISGTGHTYNSRILIRLFRNPTDAADTYAGDAVLTSVGLHYSANIGQP